MDSESLDSSIKALEAVFNCQNETIKTLMGAIRLQTSIIKSQMEGMKILSARLDTLEKQVLTKRN